MNIKHAILAIASACLLIGCIEPSDNLDNQLSRVIANQGLKPIKSPKKHNMSSVALGQALFFDKILSGDKTMACASCHHPELGTSDGLSLPVGVGGQGFGPTRIPGAKGHFIPRNAPDLFNRGQAEWTTMFWDSRLDFGAMPGITPAKDQTPKGLKNALSAQALFPPTSRDEMRGNIGTSDVANVRDSDFTVIWDTLTKRVKGNRDYKKLLAAAYPNKRVSDIGIADLGNALGDFQEEAFTLTNSPYDRYLRGDKNALSTKQKRGMLLFAGKAKCASCHSGALLTDQDAHCISAPQVGPGKGDEAPEDFGRGRETKLEEDMFAFRTPPLRNVTETGPYMHDGSYTNLEAAVRHHLDVLGSLESYDGDGMRADFKEMIVDDPEQLERLKKAAEGMPVIDLNEYEFANLMAFVEGLTDPSAKDLGKWVPESVPSGLEVDTVD